LTQAIHVSIIGAMSSRIQKAIKTAFTTALPVLLAAGNLSCTTVSVRQTMKEYSIIVKPGKNLRPQTYETGEGETNYLNTEPTRGNGLMIIIRGKL
jgi:hypothetical protein